MFFTRVFSARRFSTALMVVALALTAAGGTAYAQTRAAPAVLAVSGAVRAPVTLDLAGLQALPPVSAAAGGKTYTGASLWTLLNTVGITLDNTRRNPGHLDVRGGDG